MTHSFCRNAQHIYAPQIKMYFVFPVQKLRLGQERAVSIACPALWNAPHVSIQNSQTSLNNLCALDMCASELGTHSLTHSLTHTLIHLLTYSLTHSYTHPLSPSLVHCFTYTYPRLASASSVS